MMERYVHIAKAVMERPWAILPSTLDMIVEIVQFRASGGVWSEEEIEARLEAVENGPRDAKSSGAVGVIPIYGVISPRAELFSQSSGGTSVESLTRAFRAALSDDDVSSILFDIDSPGGNVEGIDEIASEIREARGVKPMTALARYTMASAAYYIGAQADEVVVTPSGKVGSIGIVYAHQDVSGAMEKAGVKTTLITHGENKASGNQFEPLTDEARAEIQSHVDYYGKMFENAVAEGRNRAVKDVQENFGAGKMFTPKNAIKAGLADRVATFESTVHRLAKSAPAKQIGASTQVPMVGVSPLSFASRLALVAEEVEAVVGHARERAALRAEEGRALSSETRENLERFVALRPVLDEVEGLLAEPKKARAVRHSLDTLMAAYEGGYPVEAIYERIMNHE